MFKEFSLQTFFRYFIPGAMTLGLVFYLQKFVEAKRLIDFGLGSSKEVLESAVLLGAIFIIGYLVSSLYHFIINFPILRKVLRLNHIAFFKSAVENGFIELKNTLLNQKDTKATGSASAETADSEQNLELKDTSNELTNIEPEQLSTSGSAALFDVYFYRLRRTIDKTSDEKRFEGFFDIWNGLGSTLTGMMVGFAFWWMLPELECSNEDIKMIWLPATFFIMGIINWIQLRRWSRSYVESWFFAVLQNYKEVKKKPLHIFVRDEQLSVSLIKLRPFKNKKLLSSIRMFFEQFLYN